MTYLKNALFTAMFVCSLILAHANNIKHKISFNTNIAIDTTVASDGNIYSRIKLPDCSFSQDEGAPQLPVKTINLIIPADEEPSSMSFSNGIGTVFSLKYPVLPVQKPVPTSIDFNGTEFVQPNKKIYSLDVQYPEEKARIIRTNIIRGNKVVVIEVSPVSYNPVKNQLEVYESLEISLQLKSSEKKVKTSPVKNKNKFDGYLKALVDNPDDVAAYSTIIEKKNKTDSIGLKSAAMTTGIPVYCEYIIITPSSLASYFNDFITWKKQKGIDIELVTTENIFQNYTGDAISGINDNAGKIRQFLYDAYNNGLEYALLGGDYNTVPIRYGWGSDVISTSDYEIPTDLYFSDFDGDWNIDGDARYGEPTNDDVDYGAEIFVGRLLCSNGTQIQNWTQKLIQYEKNPGNGSTSYLRKAFYTQADQMQGYYNQAGDIVSRFGSTFTTNTIYQEIYNGVVNANSPASPQFPLGSDVIGAMNSGYGFVSWFNHGAPENIAVGTKYYNDCGGNDKKKVTNYDSNSTSFCLYPESSNGLDGLSNSNKPFILYTIACETMPFDTWNGIAPTDNLGATITIQSGKGGPIYLGNTRYGYVTDSWYMQQNFTANITGGTYRLGVAEANSKGSSGFHYVWLSHNLLGCPETEMWTSTPATFANAFAAKCGNNVVVNTGGVTYCTVCVMSSSDNGASYWSVDETSLTQKTFYNVSEPFVVTITKHNYIPLVIQSSEIDTLLSNSITGPSLVCSSGASFEIKDVPSGAAIIWTQSSNISRVSDQGSNPCTFSALSSGEGWIQAQVTDACNNSTTLPQEDVWVGSPSPGTITIQMDAPPHRFTASIDDVPTANSYNWYLDGVLNTTYHGTSAIFNRVSPYCGSWYGVEVEEINDCGTSAKTSGLAVEPDCLYLLQLTPNPTGTESTVELVSEAGSDIDPDVAWDLEVYDPGQLLKEKQSGVKGKSTKLNASNWKEGVYIIRANYNGNVLTNKLVVKH